MSRALCLALGVVGFVAVGALTAPSALADGPDPGDEIVFYRDDGLFRYYDIRSDGSIPTPILAGDNYTEGWDSIVALDLDGRGQDEIFFYRGDGLFRFYNIKSSGHVGTPLIAGDTYTEGWTAITGVDLDGDGQDEMFFYRADGLYRFYDVRPDGRIGTPILAGDNYTPGWTSVVAVDMDGDGQDEMFFYREDGLYRYYNVRANGSLGQPILAGSDYSADWNAITAIDLDGDRQDEMFFYRQDGTYQYYNVSGSGSLSPLTGGSNYTSDWSSITAINLHGDLPIERVSRFTTFFNCCEPRVTNIRTMARAVNGTVVMPGETFSIDELIGPRTSAKGYVPAGYLVNGAGQCCAIGGGVSQFGTTIHNAVFWGGYQVVRHRPHTGWISRYPLGIEATLVYSSIDYKFTNNTPTPVTIRTSTTSSSVTVELWGNQGGWQMSGHHPSGARSSSIAVIDPGGADAKRVSATVTGSAPGSVRIVRRLTQGGSTTSQTWFWNYVS
jgi:hypothetical protein